MKPSHVIQPALLCADLDATMDRLHAMFGIYPSERVDIRNTGVHNAVYALGDFTFLELIQPYDPEAAAMRLLQQRGEGFHMVAIDLEPIANDDVEAELERGGFRVVRRNRTERIQGAWHLHPKDTLGVLIALDVKTDPRDNSEWAGKAWREFVRTNTRVLQSAVGVSIACPSLEHGRERYEALGFSFGDVGEHLGDAVVECWLPFGTVLQLRSPRGATSLARYTLDRSPDGGLCHLILSARDLSLAEARMRGAGASFQDGRDTLVTAPETTWGIPVELRAADVAG